MIRTELRGHVFKILFQMEFNEPEELTDLLDLYLDNLDHAEEQDIAYIRKKCRAVQEKTPEIDALINEKCKGWKTNRMNKVDLAILRLAVYEMKWDDDVPVGVAINEAVELAKRFSGEDGPSFVNGVLARLV